MTDSMNKELIKQVQSSLVKHINRPQLTEKLLNKPPFKFLHDIVTNVIRNTHYLLGVFADEEMISTNVTTKETKIKFLEKLINAVQSTTAKTITAKPSKIVAGLEVTKTLELLLAIVYGIEMNNKKTKAQNPTDTKTKKLETTKLGNQNKIKVLEKTKSQEKKLKENIDLGSQKNLQKVNNEGLIIVKNIEPVNTEIDLTKTDVESPIKPINEEVQNIVDDSFKMEKQNESKLQSSMRPNQEKGDPELMENTNQEENQLRKLSETHNISKLLRPKSSRPPAPNRRPQSNTYTEIPKHSDSFFSKHDKIDDTDDNIVTIEVVNENNKLSYDSYTQENGEGHLVSQILQTQLDFNVKKADLSDRTEKIEWKGKNIKDQEMLTKEMDTIKQFIQDITKSANPLSKLINNMQENIDQMNRELNYWKNFTEKTNEKLDYQKQIAEEKFKPMVVLLEKLKTDVEDELEMMDYCKANIIKNKAHIKYLISERFTLKKN